MLFTLYDMRDYGTHNRHYHHKSLYLGPFYHEKIPEYLLLSQLSIGNLNGVLTRNWSALLYVLWLFSLFSIDIVCIRQASGLLRAANPPTASGFNFQPSEKGNPRPYERPSRM